MAGGFCANKREQAWLFTIREKLGGRGGVALRREKIALLLLLTVVAGCSGRRDPAPPPLAGESFQEQEAVVVQTEPVPIARQMEGQTGIVQMVMTDSSFEPRVIATGVGQRVKIHLVNRGTKEHTLTIPRWSVFSRNLGPGEENYVEFTASEKGVWPFFSDAPGEPEPGLAGDLKVE